MAVLVGLGVTVVVPSSSAAGEQTPAEYCSKFASDTDKVNACLTGATTNNSCQDYAILFSDAYAKVCNDARAAKKAGQIVTNVASQTDVDAANCKAKADGSVWDTSTNTCISVEDARANCIATAQKNPGSVYWDGGEQKCITGQPDGANSDEAVACNAKNDGSYWDVAGKTCISGADAKASCLTNAANNPGQMHWDDDAMQCVSGTANTPQSNTGGSSDVANNTDLYKKAILEACAPYQGDQEQALSCLYGGLGDQGQANKPVTALDCLSSGNLVGSGTQISSNQAACEVGRKAGNAFINSQSNSGSSSTSSGSSDLSFDQLSSIFNLNSLIDVMHALGPNSGLSTDKINSTPDNALDYYIDGAGGKQKIKTWMSGKDGAPTLVWFNGGGWVSNDGTAEYIAQGSTQKNAPNGVGKFIAPVPGGGATARGVNVIEVQYRLGTSGVYYQFEDVLRGLKHVIANASGYGIDPSKIAVGGDSAGGSLSMRVAASGVSGAAVGVGWSPPTNGYTALFKSFSNFLIGIIHSTCIPTSPAGAANMTDLFLGGNGKVAEEGKDILSGGIGDLTGVQDGSADPMTLISKVLTTAQYALTAGVNAEQISKKIEVAYNNGDPNLGSIMGSGLPSSLFNVASKTLTSCLDNFKALSPAIYASPNTPPSIMVGFDIDNMVDPQQMYDMRDKLRSMGIRSDVVVLKGDPDVPPPAIGPSENHMGYDPQAVCPTINFIFSVVGGGDSVNCNTNMLPDKATGPAPTNPLGGLQDILGGLGG